MFTEDVVTGQSDLLKNVAYATVRGSSDSFGNITFISKTSNYEEITTNYRFSECVLWKTIEQFPFMCLHVIYKRLHSKSTFTSFS